VIAPAVCRFCGAKGLEDPAIDPAPGVCPACLEARMTAAVDALDRYADGRTRAEIAAEGVRLLEKVGMTPAAARAFIRSATP
jgi:hypothetical protein